jgi:AcrR family transcriptional regulator
MNCYITNEIRGVIMPPVEKISRQMVLEATFAITRVKGFAQVNARTLAAQLGCSTQPIYSRFGNMDDLKRAFILYLEVSFSDYVKQRIGDDNPLIQTSLAYISFAKEEPHLFSLLFLTSYKGKRGLGKNLKIIERLGVVGSMSRKTGIDPDVATGLYRNMMLYAHGIAVMVATKQMDITEDELHFQLESAYSAFLHQVDHLQK